MISRGAAALITIAVAGIAAFAWYRQRPGLPTALLTGAAGAVCASGKYIGLLPVILVAPFLRMPGTRDRWRTMAFLGAFVAVYAALNLQFAQNPKAVVESIGGEMEHQLYDETGADRPWEQWIHALGFSGIAAMGIGMISLGKTARQDTSTQWFAFTTMMIYFACLSFVVRMTQRYMLPIYLVSWWLAGLGERTAASLHPGRLDSFAWRGAGSLVVTAGTETHGVLDRARALLADGYGITHATFQVEPIWHTIVPAMQKMRSPASIPVVPRLMAMARKRFPPPSGRGR